MRPRILRFIHAVVITALLLPVGLVGRIPAAYAAGVIVVTTLADENNNGNGLCSLREAIAAANSLTDVDGCHATGFTAPVAISLVQNSYEVASTLNITGNVDIIGGPSTISFDTNQIGSVFYITGT